MPRAHRGIGQYGQVAVDSIATRVTPCSTNQSANTPCVRTSGEHGAQRSQVRTQDDVPVVGLHNVLAAAGAGHAAATSAGPADRCSTTTFPSGMRIHAQLLGRWQIMTGCWEPTRSASNGATTATRSRRISRRPARRGRPLRARGAGLHRSGRLCPRPDGFRSGHARW